MAVRGVVDRWVVDALDSLREVWIIRLILYVTLGVNPGLGFRPLPDDPDEGSLIWYEASNQTQVKIWTDRLDKFLERKSILVFLSP